MRGEHLSKADSVVMTVGSSPHARGALELVEHAQGVDGIIPACAGSTASPYDGSLFEWDHPRMRGEHGRQLPQAAPSLGSSPHARGALQKALTHLSSLGIIPACAGSTLRDQRVWSPFSLNTFTFCKL